MKFDCYKILCVDRNASISDIKKSYRNLAKKYHPDRNPNDDSSEERFKLVTEAYEVLKDSEKRDAYDRIISSGPLETQNNAGPTWENFFSADETLGDFLRGFYNIKDAGRPKGHDGRDLRYNLKLTFKEAALGVKTEIMIPVRQTCPQCGGTGRRAGTKSVICYGCHGKGKVKTWRGLFETCQKCSGAGAVGSAACKRCKASGKIQARRTIAVNVPLGVETGTRVYLKGMGMPGKNGGRPGSLILVMHVKNHPLFKREGLNIICPFPIPFFKAALGCTLEIPMLEGKKTIKIPPGTQTGKEIRLRGRGIRAPQDQKRGDLIVRLKVEMPKKLSREDRRILRMLDQNSNLKNYRSIMKFNRAMERLYNT